MIIDSLYIYPIKSLAGINVQSAEITPRGFKYDREWMLVDPQGRFVSQREIPEMALMKVSLLNKSLKVSFKDYTISFDSSKASDQYLTTRVWEDTFKSCLVSEPVSEWFSDMLGQPLRLVTYSPKDYRVRKPSNMNRAVEVSYADGYPFLIIGTASLDDLNSKLVVKMKMNRFRPNIVIKTNVPFEEDEWKRIAIGVNGFEIVKPCARCMVTTIHQTTLERGKEPLYTLSKYRQKGHDILFGVNAIASGDKGQIKTGDFVAING